MIRVLVADDSATFRAILRTVLGTAADLEVVGEARDGEEAVARTLALRPDVVTMDVRMPRLGGLEAIRRIMQVAPTPVIVVSAEASEDEQRLGFEALRAGAVEVLPKPRRSGAAAFERQAEAIRAAVRAVAAVELPVRRAAVAARAVPAPLAPGQPRPAAVLTGGHTVPSAYGEGTSRPPGPPLAPGQPRPAAPSLVRAPVAPAIIPAPEAGRARVIGIAASTGGPAALAHVLAPLPRDYALPILVVQHIAAGFEDGLVRWLGGETRLRVALADDGAPLEPGAVLVARNGRHLAAAGGRVRLDDAPPVRGFRPSGTVLFAALAAEYGAGAAGLVLTGMGDDGAAGLRALRDAGGYTAAQGKASSVVHGMPGAALACGAARVALELEEVPDVLLALAGRPP